MADVRLIDANALSKILRDLPFGYAKSFAGQVAIEKIKNAPTIDAAPVVHGRWESCYEDWRHQLEGNKCSVCGFEYYGNLFNYCPNCGAKMDGGATDGNQ